MYTVVFPSGNIMEFSSMHIAELYVIVYGGRLIYQLEFDY